MIIVIVGPTGVGKTKLSISLAKKYDAVIVNADAVQIYRELNIGSAKPSKLEMQEAEHLMFDIKNITENYTVADYQKDLRIVLDKNKNKNIILVGGTGLYVNAGLYDYKFDEDIDNNDYENLSLEELQRIAIKKGDTESLDLNNKHRLIRHIKRKSNNTGNKQLYDAIFIGLKTSRDVLYENINKRVDNMINDGLLDEVKSLYQYKDKSRVLNSAIGYKEVIDYLNNDISLDEAIELIKKRSRNYAKRQFTWFNNKLPVNWFEVNYEDFDQTTNEVINFIKKSN